MNQHEGNASDPWDQLVAITNELENSYWVPMLSTPFDMLDKLVAKSVNEEVPTLHKALETFRTNLFAAKELLELPYMLVAPLIPEVMQKAKQFKGQATNGEFPSSEQEAKAMDMVAAALVRSREQFSRRPELQRLMHQASLLTWSAFETYCKTVFIAAVNQAPSLYAVLLKNQALKERFGLQQSAWPAMLEAHSYDLNGKLGTIIAADKDFSSPQLLKDLFPVLFDRLPGEKRRFLEPFDSDEFWKLGQRRHLIAHRCGIVDEEYQKRTNDVSQPLGQLLQLRGRDVGGGFGVVAKLAVGLFARARYCWYTPEQVAVASGLAERPDSLS